MLSLDELIDMAEAQGHRVDFRWLGRRWGEIYASGLIVINPRATVIRQRVTLAHEMGHWFHGHDWSRPHDREQDEREADTFAARLLISVEDYARAEHIVGAHTGALARELAVTPRLVTLRRRGLRQEAASRPDLFDNYGWA